jgi:hypothetical protein
MLVPPVMMTLEIILPAGAVITLLTVEGGRLMLGFVTVQGCSLPECLATAFMSANKTDVRIQVSIRRMIQVSMRRMIPVSIRRMIQVSIRRTSLSRTDHHSNRISKFIVLVAAVKEYLNPASHNRSSYGDLRARIRRDLVRKFIVLVAAVRGCLEPVSCTVGARGVVKGQRSSLEMVVAAVRVRLEPQF